MLIAMVGKLFAALLVDQFSNALAGSLNLMLNCVVGIFLLNEDEHLKQAYDFMVRTCFSPCHDQCNGGMSCLVTFAICCCITVFLDVLLYGAINNIIKMANMVFGGMISDTTVMIAIFL